MSAGVVSASSRKRASLSLTTSSWRARSLAAPSTPATARRKPLSSSLSSRGLRLSASIQPDRRPRVSIGAQVGARRPEVLREDRWPRLVAVDHGQHAIEHARRQPHAGAHQEAAAVVRQLEQSHLLDLELAGHRGDRGFVKLLERQPLERALGQLGHRRLSACP